MSLVVKVPSSYEWSPPEFNGTRWWQSDSEFSQLLASHGYRPCPWLLGGQEIPLWSCGKPSMSAFWHGAFTLAETLYELDYDDRLVIAHGDGGQVAVLAVVILGIEAVPIKRLLTVNTPVRRDMSMYYDRVTCRWRHLYTRTLWNSLTWSKAWGSFGRFSPQMPGRSWNRELSKFDYSVVLTDPKKCLDTFREEVLLFLPKASMSCPGPDGDPRQPRNRHLSLVSQ
jgi:hypothetical protein